MPEIVVIDPGNVTLDGIPAGSITDVILNHDPRDEGGFRGALLAAIRAWGDGLRLAHDAECKGLCDRIAAEIAAQAEAFRTAQAESNAAHAASVSKMQARHETELAEKVRVIDGLRVQVEALGGTELGKELARQAECRRLRKEKARIEARLAEVDRKPA